MLHDTTLKWTKVGQKENEENINPQRFFLI